MKKHILILILFGIYLYSVGAVSICAPNYQYVGILSKNSYGINEKINNVIVDVRPTVGDNANIRVVAIIKENDVEISDTVIDTLTTNNGTVKIDFDYSHNRGGKLVIEVVVDPTGTPYTATKNITIQSTLEVKINCPLQGNIQRDIQCTWKIQDAETKNLVDVTPKIILTQGTESLSYTPMGRTGLTFKTDKIGSVFLQVTANKEGYIGDIDELTIPIQSLTTTQTFNLDNKDIFTYSSGIDTGTHKLNFIIEETGQPIEVRNIEAKVRTPSGQEVPIIFNKVSTGKYETNYNFVQAGQTYSIFGAVNFVDITKDPLRFEYKVLTLGAKTEEEKTNLIYIIVGISAFIVMFVIILIIIKRR